ncbi:ATP-binding protein [Piscinibacter terrae]|uniref:Virulence sensor protein BvgS n=1 Tax=Piscinibacter terrae TaxID=2496871 RepID=A0A3N7HKX2_9BURK|nr:ATP-binding protein [Albitalea terrae]RQP21211.1 PAS domain S-box protein [Albitalea terrae]
MPTSSFEQILLRTLADHMPQRIYAKDLEGRFVFANLCVARGMGVSLPSDLIGRTDADFYPPEASEQYRREETEVMQTGRPMVDREEHVHYTRSGTEAWMLTTKVPLVDDDGKVIGIAGINHDITDRKAAEFKLRQAMEQAQEATLAKSRFLASMSHELRTPLNCVLGYARLLQDRGELSIEQRSNLQMIEHSGRHLLALINDLLDIAKIEEGKLELTPAEVHLPDLLAAVCGIMRVKATEKHIGFACSVDPALPAVVLVDNRRLSQVLLNLLGNAVKFTDVGEVRMSVKLAGASAGGVRVRFEVRDTGMGMSSQEIHHIFDPYVQVGDEVRRSEGTGLGLAISRQIVGAMGSDIDVRSAPGLGSLFCFELEMPAPLTREAAAAGTTPPISQDAPLPEAELQSLEQLARIGNMGDIARFATHLQTLSDSHRLLADQLRTMASRCESKAILDFVQALPRKAA